MRLFIYITSVLVGIGLAIIPEQGINSSYQQDMEVLREISERKELKFKPKTIKEISDSICLSIGVPPKLVREIGNNESGWRCIKSLSGGTDYGDLQVIEKTFQYWYDRLGLEGGKTRKNYLIVGIHYLKYNHDRYKSWEKARYAYARGSWKNPDSWTALEKKFMGKIDFTQYDM